MKLLILCLCIGIALGRRGGGRPGGGGGRPGGGRGPPGYKCGDGTKPDCECPVRPCKPGGNKPTCSCKDGSAANPNEDPINDPPCPDSKWYNKKLCACEDGTELGGGGRPGGGRGPPGYRCDDGTKPSCECTDPPCKPGGNKPTCTCNDGSTPLVPAPCDNGDFPVCEEGSCKDGSAANPNADPINNPPCPDGKWYNKKMCECE